MKVYIAGQISGIPNYRERFSAAVKNKEDEGDIVLNPAELPEGMEKRDYMKICFAMIDVADKVCFIPGWEMSQGAMIEHCYCQYINKKIEYLYWGAQDHRKGEKE